MADHETTLNDLKTRMASFVNAREWAQFHAPKNLAMSLSIEAAELMEHFQWITVDDSQEIKNDPKVKEAVAQEMSDVLSYLVALANVMDIDIAEAFFEKIKLNELKYPIDQFKGRYR